MTSQAHSSKPLKGVHILSIHFMQYDNLGFGYSACDVTASYPSPVTKAYIPLRRKIPGVRGWHWAMPPDARRYQHVGIFWRYLTLKFAFSLTPSPDASQWNICWVRSQRKILALAMYISCFLCRFHLRLVPNANPISSGIWA